MTPSSNPDYILGVTREEYARLGLQHELWATRTIRLWRRAGLPENPKRGLKVLDCGCGPGFTTFELANYLGKNSEVLGIDLAEKYLRALEARAAAETSRGEKSRLAKVSTKHGALDTFTLSHRDYDAAYARWIFIFLKNPEAAIRNIAHHLKPGGLFMLQEYIDYGTLALHPTPPHFSKIRDAIIASWNAAGGDANVAAKLPELLVKNGFEIVSLKPQARVGRPHQKIWQWPDSFFRNYLPILARDGFLTAEEAESGLREWERATANPASFYVGPLVLDIVAQKR